MEGVDAHQLAQLQKVRHTSRFLQRLIKLHVAARHVDAVPKCSAQRRNLFEGELESCFVACHPTIIPHDLAELAMEGGYCSPASDREKLFRSLRHFFLRRAERIVGGVDLLELVTSQVVADGVRNYEISIGQALHQSARTEPVSPVIREVRLASD